MHSDSYFRIELIFFPRLYEIQRKNCSKCREVKRQIALFCVHVNDSDNKWTNNMMKLSKDSPRFLYDINVELRALNKSCFYMRAAIPISNIDNVFSMREVFFVPV